MMSNSEGSSSQLSSSLDELIGSSIRKKRTPKACFWCNKRKVKCDGGFPCSTCTRTKVDCFYAKSKYRRKVQSVASSDEVSDIPDKRSRADDVSFRFEGGGKTPKTSYINYDKIGFAPISAPAGAAAHKVLDNVESPPISSDIMIADETLRKDSDLHATEPPMLGSCSNKLSLLDNDLYNEFKTLYESMIEYRPVCRLHTAGTGFGFDKYGPTLSELNSSYSQIFLFGCYSDMDHAKGFDSQLLKSGLNKYISDDDLKALNLPGNPSVVYIRKILIVAAINLIQNMMFFPVMSLPLLLKNFGKASKFLQYTILLVGCGIYSNLFMTKARMQSSKELREQYNEESKFDESYFFELLSPQFLLGANEASTLSLVALALLTMWYRFSTKSNVSAVSQGILSYMLVPVIKSLHSVTNCQSSKCPVFGHDEGKVLRSVYWSFYFLSQILMAKVGMDNKSALPPYPLKFPVWHSTDDVPSKISEEAAGFFGTGNEICDAKLLLQLPTANALLLELQAATMSHKTLTVAAFLEILDRNPDILYRHLIMRIDEHVPGLDMEVKKDLAVFFSVTGSGSLQPAIPNLKNHVVHSMLLFAICVRIVQYFRKFSCAEFDTVYTRDDFYSRVVNPEIFVDLSAEYTILRQSIRASQLLKDEAERDAMFAHQFLEFCSIVEVYKINLEVSLIQWFKNYIACFPDPLNPSNDSSASYNVSYLERLRVEGIYFAVQLAVRVVHKPVSRSINAMAKSLFTKNSGRDSGHANEQNGLPKPGELKCLEECVKICLQYIGVDPEPVSVRCAVAYTDLLYRELRHVGVLLGTAQPIHLVNVSMIHLSRFLRIVIKLEQLCAAVAASRSSATPSTLLPSLRRHAEHLCELKRTVLFYLDITRLVLMIMSSTIASAFQMFKFVDRMIKFVLRLESRARERTGSDWSVLVSEYVPLPGSPRLERLSQIRDGSDAGGRIDFALFEGHMVEPTESYYYKDHELSAEAIEMCCGVPSRLVNALKVYFSEIGLWPNDLSEEESQASVNIQPHDLGTVPGSNFSDFGALLNSSNLAYLTATAYQTDSVPVPPSDFNAKWDFDSIYSSISNNEEPQLGDSLFWDEESFGKFVVGDFSSVNFGF